MPNVLFIIFCIVKNIRLIKVGQLCKTPKMSTSNYMRLTTVPSYIPNEQTVCANLTANETESQGLDFLSCL